MLTKVKVARFFLGSVALGGALWASRAGAQEGSGPEPSESRPVESGAPAAAPKPGGDESQSEELPPLEPRPEGSLLDLPLEQLTTVPVRVPVPQAFDTQVTSVARTPVRVARTPAAVYVITQEDIRRSGVRSLPDALRMAPGVNVAQIDTNTFAISIRGFNDQFSNKLLVLIDGRTIYTPTFSGVYWELRDVLLADVERIEVIRGPGSTIWGSNAVNGIINIITYSAKDTQGAYAGGGAGNQERAFGEGRIGGKIGDEGYYRVWTKYFDRGDGSIVGTGQDANDRWDNLRGGFRIDKEYSDEDALMVQGEMFKGRAGILQNIPIDTFPFTISSNAPWDFTGGNILGRFSHKFSDEADWSIQLYYDRTDIVTASISEIRDIIDLDFVNRFPVGEGQNLTWGTGYRFTTDQESGTFALSFDPPDRSLHFANTFIQDEFKLIKDRLSWFLGSKFEYNTFTGFVIQPGTRLLWTPDERQTVWGSVTRAVRIPSRAEDDIRIVQQVAPAALFPNLGPLPPGSLVAGRLIGNRYFYSEEVLALETGYRVAPTERLAFDATTFLNFYGNLRTVEPTAPVFVPGVPPIFFIQQTLGNLMYGETWGFELASTWDVTDFWKLRGSYSFLDMQMHLLGSSQDTTTEAIEGQSPQSTISMRSFLQLTRTIDFDTSLYYVDTLPAYSIPSYARVDVRLAWHPTRSLELILGVQNLFDEKHQEFVPSIFDSAIVDLRRSVYGMVTWRF